MSTRSRDWLSGTLGIELQEISGFWSEWYSRMAICVSSLSLPWEQFYLAGLSAVESLNCPLLNLVTNTKSWQSISGRPNWKLSEWLGLSFLKFFFLRLCSHRTIFRMAGSLKKILVKFYHWSEDSNSGRLGAKREHKIIAMPSSQDRKELAIQFLPRSYL